MTPALQDEWKRHASRFMTSWLVSMEQRGRVRRERDKVVQDLRTAVDEQEDAGIREALRKDLHLSEAAVLHRIPVASLDDRQRRFLGQVAESYGAAGRIQWFNPHTDDPEKWRAWIEAGCPDSDVFQTSS